jgi:MoaA/NifB/PqqE/SkfB family radical SAM enzyme
MEDGMEAVTFSGGGEPTLHPKFPEIVKNSTKELKYGLFTNALDPIKYDAGKFDWIRVTKTNKDFNDENIKKLSENCKSVGLCINYKDASEQIEEIEHALTLANKYDLEYVQLRPALNIMGEITYISAPAKYRILLDKKLIITDYKFQKCKDKNRRYKRCEGYHFTPMVWENGMMSACMYMRHNHDYDIGSIYDHTFTELCNMMPESLPVLDDCQICCKNNEINKFISDAKNIKNRRFV